MKGTQPRLFLLDVEGTIAPISLVTDQLFPYARMHFPRYLQEKSRDPAVQGDLALLVEENAAETEAGCPRITAREDWEEGVAYLLWLMDRDRKSTALKSLQGRLWKGGFEKGDLKGTLFDDVPGALERWSANGQVAIYSSGSVAAQILLFRYSTFGDLTSFISGYFDTRTGPKNASSSYRAISTAMDVGSREILFFSDAVRELDAAHEAGCQTRLTMRDGNAEVLDAHHHRRISSFNIL